MKYIHYRTNLPREIMQIPDFPMKEDEGSSFVHHSIIREYLWDYAKHFNLYPHIKVISKKRKKLTISDKSLLTKWSRLIFHQFYFQLNTLVKHVEPETLRNGQTIWMITYQDLETKVETTRTFDAVVVCNGHYTVGHIPHIPGIESFSGESIHSHQYRVPEMFARKKVCILGASWSGIDIAMEISQYAEKVNVIYVSCLQRNYTFRILFTRIK